MPRLSFGRPQERSSSVCWRWRGRRPPSSERAAAATEEEAAVATGAAAAEGITAEVEAATAEVGHAQGACRVTGWATRGSPH